ELSVAPLLFGPLRQKLFSTPGCPPPRGRPPPALLLRLDKRLQRTELRIRAALLLPGRLRLRAQLGQARLELAVCLAMRARQIAEEVREPLARWMFHGLCLPGDLIRQAATLVL